MPWSPARRGTSALRWPDGARGRAHGARLAVRALVRPLAARGRSPARPTLVPWSTSRRLAARRSAIAELHARRRLPPRLGRRRRDRAATTERRSPANLAGTLDAVRHRRRGRLRAFVGLGSQAEYGPSDERCDEDMPPRPDDRCTARPSSPAVLTRAAGRRLRACGSPGCGCSRPMGRGTTRRDLIPYRDPDRSRRGARPLSQGTQRWDYLYVDGRRRGDRGRSASSDAAQRASQPRRADAWTVRAVAEEVRDLIDPAVADRRSASARGRGPTSLGRGRSRWTAARAGPGTAAAERCAARGWCSGRRSSLGDERDGRAAR